MTRYTLLTAVAGLTLLFAACTTDSYETGEGTYSRMVADFAELKSNDQKQGVSFVKGIAGKVMNRNAFGICTHC